MSGWKGGRGQWYGSAGGFGKGQYSQHDHNRFSPYHYRGKGWYGKGGGWNSGYNKDHVVNNMGMGKGKNNGDRIGEAMLKGGQD